MSYYLMLAVGFALLVVGAESLVKGAVAIAGHFGMSPLLIGLVLVGFGTSTPELVTSVEAAMAGSPGIAVGNIVGSNISNILLVLGVSAIVAPIAVNPEAFARDGTLVFLAAVLFTAIGAYLPLDRAVGAGLVTGLLAYLFCAYRRETTKTRPQRATASEKAGAHEEGHGRPARTRDAARPPSKPSRTRGISVPILLTVGGLLILIAGGSLLVDGAIGIARVAGISETAIGLTVVAIGTSLPELATSAVAALRKHGDVALGNVLGSSLYNILGVAGLTGLISPTVVPPHIARFDNLVMVASAAVLLLFALAGSRIGRGRGALLLASYCAYLFVVFLT